MATVIPGALADHLTGQTIADAETVAALDAARRGRGRTLVIEPTSTRVLHVISAYAEAILENRKLHTTVEVRAARMWIQRAGHAVPAPAAEQAPAASANAFEQGAADPLANQVDLAETVICPTRPPLDDDQALAAEAHLDQVEAEAAEQFDHTAHAIDAVEHAEAVKDAEALYAVKLVTEAEATEGTWQGVWIGEHHAADALFEIDRAAEQGALFDGRAAQ